MAYLHPPQEEPGEPAFRDAVGDRRPAFSGSVADPQGGNPLAAADRAFPGPMGHMTDPLPPYFKPPIC